MTTTDSHTNVETNVVRISEATETIVRRLRLAGLGNDVIGINTTVWDVDSALVASIHAETFEGVNRIAAYFQLTHSEVLAGNVLSYARASLIGAPGVQVEVYGPAGQAVSA